MSALPENLYRASQLKELDRIAIEEFGIPGFELMKIAASAAFDVLLDRWPDLRRLFVFTGSGNNAGDGYLLAAMATKRVEVTVVEVGDAASLGEDAQKARQWCLDQKAIVQQFEEFALSDVHRLGADISTTTVFVDSLLGIGITRATTGKYANAIEAINSSGLPILAIDIPSGLCADTGAGLGETINASVTVTFIGLKQGLLTCRGVDHVGRAIALQKRKDVA